MLKRTCSICGHTLSVYNREDICFCHQEGMVVKGNSALSICTSPTPPEIRGDIPQENTARYSKDGFNPSVTGYIDRHGRAVALNF